MQSPRTPASAGEPGQARPQDPFLLLIAPDKRPLMDAPAPGSYIKGRQIAVTAAETSTPEAKLAALADAFVMLLLHSSWMSLLR